MKNRKLKRFLEKKAFLLVVALCVLSALGMYGVYRMEMGKSSEENEGVATGLVDLNEMTGEQELAVRDQVTTTAKAVNAGGEKTPLSEVTDEVEETSSQVAAVEYEDPILEEETAQTMVQSTSLSFDQNKNIKWPVKGNIILDYSPDNTVYFATLEQYRCNPSILIQAEAGTAVSACADGKVKEITKSDELGTTLTLDLGNGYEAVYGQLADIKVASGATVSAGEPLAVVATPSKYYVVEGNHVYFQMLKDGEPINPRAFLE